MNLIKSAKQYNCPTWSALLKQLKRVTVKFLMETHLRTTGCRLPCQPCHSCCLASHRDPFWVHCYSCCTLQGSSTLSTNPGVWPTRTLTTCKCNSVRRQSGRRQPWISWLSALFKSETAGHILRKILDCTAHGGQTGRLVASAGARAYNGGPGAEPPVGVRG